MQTKSHYLWELAKVALIPLLTAGIIYWGLFSSLSTKVDMMSVVMDKLEANVMELIKDRR
jgi:hypothetical protein